MIKTSWLFKAYVCATLLAIFGAFIFLTWLYASIISTVLTVILFITTMANGAMQLSEIVALEAQEPAQ